MKMMLLGLGVFSFLLFVGAGIGFAEDSVNIQVSCTVPAIPGVNSPLLEAQSIIANPGALTSENRKIALQNSQYQPLPTIQQEDTEKENQSSEGQKDIVLVKTFYVR